MPAGKSALRRNYWSEIQQWLKGGKCVKGNETEKKLNEMKSHENSKKYPKNITILVCMVVGKRSTNETIWNNMNKCEWLISCQWYRPLILTFYLTCILRFQASYNLCYVLSDSSALFDVLSADILVSDRSVMTSVLNTMGVFVHCFVRCNQLGVRDKVIRGGGGVLISCEVQHAT